MQPHDLIHRVDTVVVGAGLAGLTAANLLARHGQQVVVVDRHGLGGRARTDDVDGFDFNQGAHALYVSGRACRILTSLGVDPTGGRPPIDAAAAWDDGSVRLIPTTPMALLTTPLLATRSKLAAARILPVLRRGRHRGAAGRSLSAWMEHVRAPADVRAIIEMYVRLSTYSHAPDTLSAEAALSQLRLATDGVLYLDNGWSQLVDALAANVVAAGGRIRSDGGVAELVRDRRRWTVVLGGDDHLSADAVILATGSPQTAVRLAGEDPGWVEPAGPPTEAACLDLGLRQEPAVPILLSTDEPLYGSVHAPTAKLAPAGRSVVSVVRYLAPGEQHDRHETRRELEAHATRMGATPQDALTARYLHRMVVAHGTPLADRARPTGHELAADRLWAAGDWVGPVSDRDTVSLLADAAVASGADAATAVLERQAFAR